MKKAILLKSILVAAVLSLVTCHSSLSFAQTWVTANQATVGWDAVTQLENGNPVPAADRVSYNVYIKNRKTQVVISVGNTPNTQQTIVFTQEGRYFAGVSTLRQVLAADGVTVEEEMESVTVWSEDPLVCQNGENFGFRYFVNVNNPKNLRR